ncbi:DUF1543 domain-containing protein [Psychrobacter sp. CAL346-MNA-CIBAN-0220]|uniref:DUF1543 domain-containing protein n=1 Tax=Psychrobacter sp. CAL346-MNA-CIBAN-0220 TaxID=3140457 RepID=UPI0033341750
MPELFMIKIGGRPKGRLIEQHDMFFGVGDRIGDFVEAINTHWPEVKNTWHLDAYRQVTRVGNYRIQWQLTSSRKENEVEENDHNLKLFFINLGGYLTGEFEEFHHKLLIVALTQADAIKQAKQSDFYKQYSFKDKNTPFNAAAHIDDKQQVDIDEIYDVNDLLMGGRLLITPLSSNELESEEKIPEDHAYIGYLSLKKLRKLSELG